MTKCRLPSTSTWRCSFIDERFLIIADLLGALVFGPLVHLVLLQRGVMFLELRRLTHRQRMYQART